MSNLFNAPWSNAEKVALLTSILEGAGVDVPAVLLHSINSNNLIPMWNDIVLPPGMYIGTMEGTPRASGEG